MSTIQMGLLCMIRENNVNAYWSEIETPVTPYAMLLRIVKCRKVHCVLCEQVTAVMGEGGGVTPALGLAWASMVGTRLMLYRDETLYSDLDCHKVQQEYCCDCISVLHEVQDIYCCLVFFSGALVPMAQKNIS